MFPTGQFGLLIHGVYWENEQRLPVRMIEASPEPGPPVTVGLDGGYIRGRERRPRVEPEASIARGARIARCSPSTTGNISFRRRRHSTRATRIPASKRRAHIGLVSQL